MFAVCKGVETCILLPLLLTLKKNQTLYQEGFYWQNSSKVSIWGKGQHRLVI